MVRSAAIFVVGTVTLIVAVSMITRLPSTAATTATALRT